MRKKVQCPPERLPQSSPDELLHVLIEPRHALDLIVNDQVAEALVNVTRRIGEINRDNLGHLACTDILIASAQLNLRVRQLPPSMIENLHSTHDAITATEVALETTRHTHTRAQAEILISLGYNR